MKRAKPAVIASFFLSFLVFADYELIQQDNNTTINKDGVEIKIVQNTIVKNQIYLGTISALIENIKNTKVHSKKIADSLRELGMEESAKKEEIGTQKTIKMFEYSIDSIIKLLE